MWCPARPFGFSRTFSGRQPLNLKISTPHVPFPSFLLSAPSRPTNRPRSYKQRSGPKPPHLGPRVYPLGGCTRPHIALEKVPGHLHAQTPFVVWWRVAETRRHRSTAADPRRPPAGLVVLPSAPTRRYIDAVCPPASEPDRTSSRPLPYGSQDEDTSPSSRCVRLDSLLGWKRPR